MRSKKICSKRNLERKPRKVNTLNQKNGKILIVCEGLETEKNYFNGAIEEINRTRDNSNKLNVQIVGKGMNTISLVKSLDDLLNDIDESNNRIVPYEKIFVVFDKDSFKADNFNNAITICNNKGFIPLWSNQAIEYWFLLHFHYLDSKMDRTLYANKLEEYFKNAGLNYKYRKNDKDIYSKLTRYGSLEQAIKNALNIHAIRINDTPADSESCTTIYKFFDEIFA